MHIIALENGNKTFIHEILHFSGEFELGELLQAAGRRDLHEVDGLLHDPGQYGDHGAFVN